MRAGGILSFFYALKNAQFGFNLSSTKGNLVNRKSTNKWVNIILEKKVEELNFIKQLRTSNSIILKFQEAI